MKINPQDLPAEISANWNNMTTEEQTAYLKDHQKILNTNIAKLNGVIGDTVIGAGIHLLYYKGMEQNELPVMRFDSYFNEKLALNSDYFKKMDKFMQCVERNVNAPEEAQETIC